MSDGKAISDDDICAAIIALTNARRPSGTICPSEVARSLAADETTWRSLMPRVRGCAVQLVDDGKLAILQKGQPVADPRNVTGPIRLGLPQ
ncbi:MAG: DUF3253 domain-containing protein, partial [Pseudomonadota bacterium]